MDKSNPDFKVINVCFDAIAPIIRAHGANKENVETFVYYLLIISAAMADEINMDVEQFKSLAMEAWASGNQTTERQLN